jgi:hypothetical protein
VRRCKNPNPFFHGGNLIQLQQRPRYDFPYLFATDEPTTALKYAKLNKGHLWRFVFKPKYYIDFKNENSKSKEFLDLIYFIAENKYSHCYIFNVTDFGVKTNILLITDFSLVKNIIRV